MKAKVPLPELMIKMRDIEDYFPKVKLNLEMLFISNTFYS
jgi:hypothetical protein